MPAIHVVRIQPVLTTRRGCGLQATVLGIETGDGLLSDGGMVRSSAATLWAVRVIGRHPGAEQQPRV
jgi:hypothetical protein